MKTTAIFTIRTTLNGCSKGLAFVSNGDGTCSVSGIGTCTDINVKIPSVYNGDVVKRIDRRAFEDCSSLKSITIPDGVTSIGDNAFSDCINLKSITIPDSVTSIGYGAFWCCNSLKSVTIPASVMSIGEYAFADARA